MEKGVSGLRKIRLSKYDLLYILQNITAHDPWHDYSYNKNRNRWLPLIETTKRFFASNNTILAFQGGSPSVSKRPRNKSKHHETTSSLGVMDLEVSPVVGNTKSTSDAEALQYASVMANKSYFQLHELLDKTVQDIQCSLLMSEYSFLYRNEFCESCNDKTFYLWRPTDTNSSIDLIINNVYDTLYALYDETKETPSEFVTRMTRRRDSSNYIEGVIFMIIYELEVYGKIKGGERQKRKRSPSSHDQRSGKVTKAVGRMVEAQRPDAYQTDASDPKDVQAKLTGVYKDASINPNLKQMRKIVNELLRTTDTKIIDAKTKEYEKHRRFILNKMKEVLKDLGQDHKAGALEIILRPIPERLTRNFIEFLKDDYILSAIEQASNMIHTRKKVSDTKFTVRSSSSGTEESITADNFCTLLARMALYYTKCCDGNGNLTKEFKSVLISNSEEAQYLIMQTTNLLHISGWEHNDWIRPVQSGDLDQNLLEFFNDHNHRIRISRDMDEFDDLFEAIHTKGNMAMFLVNNAANLSMFDRDLKHRPFMEAKHMMFCPRSSIMDGMKTCKEGGFDKKEDGDMNFKIMSDDHEDHFYQGTYHRGSGMVSLNVKFGGFEIKTQRNANQERALEAVNILDITLKKILELLQVKRQKFTFSLNIFHDMFKHGISDSDFHKVVWENILFKGVGDIFQEIAAVAKHGGYVSNYTADYPILKYDITGDQYRVFLANDRPSGTRFVFLLTHANPADINLKAFGGYSSSQVRTNALLVRHKSMDVKTEAQVLLGTESPTPIYWTAKPPSPQYQERKLSAFTLPNRNRSLPLAKRQRQQGGKKSKRKRTIVSERYTKKRQH
jgi:hypothetical protein